MNGCKKILVVSLVMGLFVVVFGIAWSLAQSNHYPIDLGQRPALRVILIPRVAFVDVYEVFLKYKGTAAAVQEFSEYRRWLEEQVAAGAITAEEAQRLLQAMDLQLTARIQQEILAAIKEIAEREGYDWVTGKKDVVLYASSFLTDITAEVIELLNQRYAESQGR